MQTLTLTMSVRVTRSLLAANREPSYEAIVALFVFHPRVDGFYLPFAEPVCGETSASTSDDSDASRSTLW